MDINFLLQFIRDSLLSPSPANKYVETSPLPNTETLSSRLYSIFQEKFQICREEFFFLSLSTTLNAYLNYQRLSLSFFETKLDHQAVRIDLELEYQL